MGDTVKELPRFFSTEDVRKILKIGNKACLELFHREDFPCERVGKSYRIAEENFNEYFKTRRVHKWKKEDLNMQHLNLQIQYYVFKKLKEKLLL